MKQILVVHQSAEMYGSDKALLLFLLGLDKSQNKAIVVLPGEGPLKGELESAGIKVVISPVGKLYRNMFSVTNLVKFLRDTRRSLKVLGQMHRQYNFSIVYSNTLAVFLGMVFARQKKIKHIWHVHEIITHPKWIAALFPFLLEKFADMIICNSKATMANLIHRRPDLKNKSTVVYNGLEYHERQVVGNTKESFGFSQNDIVVTLVGRISRLKGHKWVLSTYAKFLSESDIKLLFVGSPVPGQEHYLTEAKQIIDDNHLGDKVKIVPFTKDLRPVWNATDIALMPSTEAESFGLVALEAMFAKKPVVASDLGGLKEVVEHDKTGILVQPNNEEALAKAIIQFSKDTGMRREYGEEGYKRAQANFTAGKYVEELTNIINEA